MYLEFNLHVPNLELTPLREYLSLWLTKKDQSADLREDWYHVIPDRTLKLLLGLPTERDYVQFCLDWNCSKFKSVNLRIIDRDLPTNCFSHKIGKGYDAN